MFPKKNGNHLMIHCDYLQLMLKLTSIINKNSFQPIIQLREFQRSTIAGQQEAHLAIMRKVWNLHYILL